MKRTSIGSGGRGSTAAGLRVALNSDLAGGGVARVHVRLGTVAVVVLTLVGHALSNLELEHGTSETSLDGHGGGEGIGHLSADTTDRDGGVVGPHGDKASAESTENGSIANSGRVAVSGVEALALLVGIWEGHGVAGAVIGGSVDDNFRSSAGAGELVGGSTLTLLAKATGVALSPGGGTSDATLVELGPEVEVEVLGRNGDDEAQHDSNASEHFCCCFFVKED